MAFSAQTCLSYMGTTELTNPLLLYSDTNEYSESFGSLSLSDITGTNCPNIITNIPDGTKKIKIVSNNLYSVLIDILCDEICNVCNLNFSGFTNVNSIGKISVSNLTGSCQSNITDYLINWYGPDSTTNLAFTSGKGTKYIYGYQHPITDLLTMGGVYRPIIQDIILSGITASPKSGVTFSSTGGSGKVLADLNCLPNLDVRDFNCSNGNSTGVYTHNINFDAKSNGVLPTPLRAKFSITGITKYFALSFDCVSVPDTVKITFSGINYSNPIVLENMTNNVGGGTFVNPSIIPRQIPPIIYSKILSLTGLTITPDDYLLIDVIPNGTNPDTSWNLSLKCLSTLDTTLGGFEIYKNNPFRISASTITSTTISCNRISYTAKLIGGASLPQIYDYLGNGNSQVAPVNTPFFYGYMNLVGQTQCSNAAIYIGSTACIATGNTIVFNRTYNSTTSAATYYMEFSNYFDFKSYYDSAMDVFIYSGSTDPTTLEYYRHVYLRHHYSKINSPLTICGDNSQPKDFWLHPPTMVVTSGMNASNYTLTIVQKKLPPPNILFPDNCQVNCQSAIDEIINLINISTTDVTPNNYITNVGLKTIDPFWVIVNGTLPVSTNKITATTLFDSYVYYRSYGNKTYPYSGSNTLIPSLSGITSSSIDSLPYHNSTNNTQKIASYQVRLPNLSNNLDYEIWGKRITNYGYSGDFELAYRYSGGTVTYSDPYYII
jgi:hypothetical protein